MSLTSTPTNPFASAADVRLVLGKIGNGTRLEQAGIDVEKMLPAAHVEVLDRLTEVYGPTLPEVVGDSLEVCRWAEAKLCAAGILDILRASLDTVSDIPERLRRSAFDTLGRSLPGLRPGDSTEPGEPVVTWSGSPMSGSSTAISNFPNPYGDDEPIDIAAGWDTLR